MNSGCFFVFLIGICLADSSLTPGHLEDLHPASPLAQKNISANSEKSVKPTVPDPSVSEPLNKTVHTTVESTNTAATKVITSTLNSSLTTLAPTSTTPIPFTPTYGVGQWNVTDEKGNACILLSGELSLILVNETSNKVIETYRVPSNAPNHGNCKMECIEFELPNNASLHLMFGKNLTNDKFYVKAIKGNITYTVQNRTVLYPFSNETLHLFESPLENSYYCNPATEEIVFQKPLEHLTLKVETFQVQAFKNSSSKTGFDTPFECNASHTPDIVPIIVGCALALLVIFVLIAYLISRRQFHSRGYVSM